MLSLIQYSDGSYDVCPTKGIRRQGSSCTVKYRSTSYEVEVISSGDDKEYLLGLAAKSENAEPAEKVNEFSLQEEENKKASGNTDETSENDREDEDEDDSSEYVPMTDSEYDTDEIPDSDEQLEEPELNENEVPNSSHDRSAIKENNTSQNSTLNSSANRTSIGCDDAHLNVDPSNGSKGAGKLYYCIFCDKKQTKFARHLLRVHSDETEVKKFSYLPAKNPERLKFITMLRNKGSLVHNKDITINNGKLFVCRRPQAKMKKAGKDFVPCSKCKGFYAKSNIRHHYQRCANPKSGNTRTILIEGRKLVKRNHPEASFKMSNRILPVLRDDTEGHIARYDRLIVLFGNKLSRKYQHPHRDKMIRSQLRLLARFVIALKDLDPEITDLQSLYNPKFYDTALKAVNKVAKFRDEDGTYETPAPAAALGTCLKKIGAILKSDCIKRLDAEKKQLTIDFLNLLEEDYGCSLLTQPLNSNNTGTHFLISYCSSQACREP
ncbi:uncharacterized protein LOC124187275 [Neodiprion fabricii]|uniref:uncharacterized protein LOC124187275 n=1 Tax=Neodiprion fabricii TaxID=2872261 RepID=UPI001ED944AB|nr:uncharacterized protein LOC124187275 [Neodiprion fabricii]